jgi:hypothetical protein
MASPFELDPNNFLGNDHNAYLSKLTAYCLKNPTDYVTLRQNVRNTVKSEQIRLLYKNFFSLLRSGSFSTNGGAPASLLSAVGAQPKVPEQEINRFVLSVVDRFNVILDELIDIILPDKINDVLGSSLAKNVNI